MLNDRAFALPSHDFYIFVAGRCATKRSYWMSEARDYKLRNNLEIVTLCVRCARGYHRDYLKALKDANDYGRS